MIKKIKNYIKTNFPKIVSLYKIFRQKKGDVSFEGWGMLTTSTNPPWNNSNNKFTQKFTKIHLNIIENIKNKNFIDTTPGNNIFDSLETLESLKWRHYLIYFSIQLVANVKDSNNYVECGVGDGLSISYVLNEIEDENSKFYLYDSWQPMIKKYLSKKQESRNIGAYNSLNYEITKNNLKNFKKKIFFNQGYIPDIFDKADNPENIAWLHIDLNSSIPTLRCLEFFYNKLDKNGVIIFDDYGWKGYEETKAIVDQFFNDKNGILFQLPTGQGIYINK